MNYTIYDYLGLFFLYAFLGWLLETSVAADPEKTYGKQRILKWSALRHLWNHSCLYDTLSV